MSLWQTYMRSKTVTKRIVSIFVLACVFVSLMFLPYFFQKSARPLALQAEIKSLSSTGNPLRLKIPGINVDASLEYVGLTSDGAMDAPKGPNEVAWFSLGPRPGESGSAVIAGHYGWKNKKVSAFDNLHTLRKGDKVYIEDENGVVITFVVRESRRYDPEADAADVFGSQDGGIHLNLVTCEGVWDAVSKTYSKRLVVFTDKEEI